MTTALSDKCSCQKEVGKSGGLLKRLGISGDLFLIPCFGCSPKARLRSHSTCLPCFPHRGNVLRSMSILLHTNSISTASAKMNTTTPGFEPGTSRVTLRNLARCHCATRPIMMKRAILHYMNLVAKDRGCRWRHLYGGLTESG